MVLHHIVQPCCSSEAIAGTAQTRTRDPGTLSYSTPSASTTAPRTFPARRSAARDRPFFSSITPNSSRTITPIALGPRLEFGHIKSGGLFPPLRVIEDGIECLRGM